MKINVIVSSESFSEGAPIPDAGLAAYRKTSLPNWGSDTIELGQGFAKTLAGLQDSNRYPLRGLGSLDVILDVNRCVRFATGDKVLGASNSNELDVVFMLSESCWAMMDTSKNRKWLKTAAFWRKSMENIEITLYHFEKMPKKVARRDGNKNASPFICVKVPIEKGKSLGFLVDDFKRRVKDEEILKRLSFSGNNSFNVSFQVERWRVTDNLWDTETDEFYQYIEKIALECAQ